MMNNILDWFITNPDLDPTEALLMKGLSRYGQFEGMEKLAGSVMPDEDRDLGREEKRLDIAMKKRALGIQTSEDYDEARNSHAPLYAITAQRLLQRIPEDGFMSGSTPKPFFKIGRSVSNGSSPASIARRIFRAVS